MKKSRSSVPRFIDRWPPGPAPPVRKEGLFATPGRPDPVPPPAAWAGPLVAIAVGNTNEGESLPAKPRDAQVRRASWKVTQQHSMAYPASRTPCRCAHIMVSNDPPRPTSPDLSLPSLRRGSDGKRGRHALVHDNGGGLVGHDGGALVRAAAAVTMAQGRRGSVVVLLRATGTGWGGVEVQDYVPLGARRWMLVRGRQPRRAPRRVLYALNGGLLSGMTTQVHLSLLSVTSSSTTMEMSTTVPPQATFMRGEIMVAATASPNV